MAKKKIFNAPKINVPKVGNVIKTAGKTIAAPVKKAAPKVGNVIKTAGKTIAAPVKKAAPKVGNVIKTAGKNVGAGIKKVPAGAKKVLNKGSEAAAIALFIPFVPVAKTFLKRRGITPAGNTKALILQVRNEMSKKSFAYSGADAFDYGVSGAEEFGYLDAEGEVYGATPEEFVTPDLVMTVINFLKSIFDNIKAKRARNEKLTPEEEEISKMAPQIENELDAAKGKASEVIAESEKKAAEITTMDSLFSWKTALIVLVLVALYLFMKKR